MIKSDIFYRAFENGFDSEKTSPLIARRRGKIPKYFGIAGGDEISFWFKVNSKASAMPNLPGEFWPVIEAKQLRYDQRDDGIVSWYQYTDTMMHDEMKQLQRAVYAKVANQTQFESGGWRGIRDSFLPSIRRFVEDNFQVQRPHDHLYYLDEADATTWGKLFARQLVLWMQRYSAQPETLDGYMWRVHWGKPKLGSS